MKRTTIFADDPVPEDPIEASKGILKGKTSLLKALTDACQSSWFLDKYLRN